MIPHASDSEVSITVYFSAMFFLLHNSKNQELFKKYVCNQSSHYKNMIVNVACPIYCLKLKHPFPFSVGYFQLVTAVKIKNCLKSTSVIKVATMKNTDDFCYAKEAIGMQPPNKCFSLSAKMNGAQRRALLNP